MPNKDRVKLIQAIECNGGHSGYPLAWGVKLRRGIVDPSGGIHQPEDGWDIDREFEWVVEDLWKSLNHREDEFPGVFHTTGRSGGWVVLAEFDGHQRLHHFLQDLKDPQSNISNETCRRLLRMLPIWDELFAQPTETVNLALEEAYKRFLEEVKEKTYWEARDVETVFPCL